MMQSPATVIFAAPVDCECQSNQDISKPLHALLNLINNSSARYGQGLPFASHIALSNNLNNLKHLCRHAMQQLCFIIHHPNVTVNRKVVSRLALVISFMLKE